MMLPTCNGYILFVRKLSAKSIVHGHLHSAIVRERSRRCVLGGFSEIVRGGLNEQDLSKLGGLVVLLVQVLITLVSVARRIRYILVALNYHC